MNHSNGERHHLHWVYVRLIHDKDRNMGAGSRRNPWLRKTNPDLYELSRGPGFRFLLIQAKSKKSATKKHKTTITKTKNYKGQQKENQDKTNINSQKSTTHLDLFSCCFF